MTIHDWTRVEAGTFHDFHLRWIGHIAEALNNGLLPADYYAQAEQHAGERIADVLALHASDPDIVPSAPAPAGDAGAVALLQAPPATSLHLTAKRKPSPKGKPRTLAIRTAAGHRIVALLELVSPSNKDRKASVREFVTKAVAAVGSGIHVSVIDLFPPGPADPHGMHAAVWKGLSGTTHKPPPDKPLAFASYVAAKPFEAFVTPAAVGDPVPQLPLFIAKTHYVRLPLADTYAATFRGMAKFWRDVLEGTGSPA
jgi:hypothetical protein